MAPLPLNWSSNISINGTLLFFHMGMRKSPFVDATYEWVVSYGSWWVQSSNSPKCSPMAFWQLRFAQVNTFFFRKYIHTTTGYAWVSTPQTPMLANCHTFWMVATFGSADMLTNFFLHAQRSLRAICREDGSPSFWISLKTSQSQSVWPKILERLGTAQVPVPNFILAFLREYGQNWRDEGILWCCTWSDFSNLSMAACTETAQKRFSFYFPHLWSSQFSAKVCSFEKQVPYVFLRSPSFVFCGVFTSN